LHTTLSSSYVSKPSIPTRYTKNPTHYHVLSALLQEAHTMVPSPSSLIPDATTSKHFKRGQKIAWAYGLTAGIGILVIGSLIGALLYLRRRHKKRKAAGLIRGTQEDARLYCVCPMCSGCKRQRGGGEEGQPCPRCKQQCEGN
jgi:hypothetical protein